MRLSALGSRILLAGFSSSTSFFAAGSFSSGPSSASSSLPKALLSRSESLLGVIGLRLWSPCRAFAGSPSRPFNERGDGRSRWPSVPEPSGFRYPIRGPPDRPNVGATFSWLPLLRQGVSLFFFTELNPLEAELHQTDQGSEWMLSDIPAPACVVHMWRAGGELLAFVQRVEGLRALLRWGKPDSPQTVPSRSVLEDAPPGGGGSLSATCRRAAETSQRRPTVQPKNSVHVRFSPIVLE